MWARYKPIEKRKGKDENSGPINDLAFVRDRNVLNFTFSKPVGATSVKVECAENGGTSWVTYPSSLNEESTTFQIFINESYTFNMKIKLVVEGGIRAGDSNVVNFILNH